MKKNDLIADRKGFTLLELMVVICIIGILAAVAVPHFGDLIAHSNEGSTKGNLGTLRSALSLYYTDTEGQFPSEGTTASRHSHHRLCLTCTTNLDALTDNEKYMSDIPDAVLPTTLNSIGHDTLDWVDPISVDGSGNLVVTDRGGWAYQWDPTKINWGTVLINCNHADSAGNSWLSF
jgi:prepilin-type N-terminal cleavage/methylation domain-containing protein